MQTPGLAHAPFTRFLLLTIPLLSIVTSSLALKPYVPIYPSPHLWPYLQFNRLATYQLSYLSSSEVLFACVLVYQMRILERIFGTRKYVSSVLVLGLWQAAIAPLVVSVLQLVTLGRWAYLPGGMTGVVIALIAMYREAVPPVWRWRLSLGMEVGGGSGRASTNANSGMSKGLILSDKSTTYLAVAQLALSQFPYNLPPAAVGWMLGLLWRAEVLPGSTWRVPAWVVGESAGAERKREFEGLRRRLEEEAERERDMGVGSSTSAVQENAGDTGRRRGVLRQVGDFFRGAV